MQFVKLLCFILLIFAVQCRDDWYKRYGERKVTYSSADYVKDYYLKNCEKYKHYYNDPYLNCEEKYVEQEPEYYEYEPKKSEFFK